MVLLTFSCKITEEALDCLSEAVSVHIHHSASQDNPYEVTFELTYNGSYNMDNSIEWDFGDGQKASGSQTIVHTYAAAGSYTVEATPTLRHDGETCSPTIERTVSVIE